MYATNYLERSFLNILKNITFTAPEEVYIGLYLTNPGEEGMGTEIKNEATVVVSAEQTANAEVQTPKKRRGRGINNDLRDVTRKKFDERTVRYRDWETDRKSTRLNSSHSAKSRMPSSA